MDAPDPIETDNQPEVRAILRQTKFEYATLQYAQAALLNALEWRTEGAVFSRKLAGVRHVYRSFCEQIDRVFGIEEHDGMADILEEHPEYAERVKKLLAEHDVIRDVLESLGIRLDRCLPTDHEGFEDLQRDIGLAVHQIEEHLGAEGELIMDAFNTDVGVGD